MRHTTPLLVGLLLLALTSSPAFAQGAPGSAAKPADAGLTLQAPPAPAPATSQIKGGTLTLSGTNVDALRYTLELRPADQRAFAFGQTVQMVLNVRNPGQVAATRLFSTRDFYAAAFSVTDAAGKTIEVVPPVELLGGWAILKKTIEPGADAALSPLQLAFQPADGPRAKTHTLPTVYAPPGKYKISYPGTNEIEVEIK
jgi:hypothetical protein